MKRNLCLIVVSCLLLTSCQTVDRNEGHLLENDTEPGEAEQGRETPCLPHVTTTTVPTDIPPTPSSTPPPTATSLPPELSGEFDYPSRVLPHDFDPEIKTEEMIKAYSTAVKDDSYHLEWYGAVVASNSRFYIWISTLSTDPEEKIDLIYPLRATITRLDIPADHLNVVSPMGGGGGGYIQEMQPFVLEPGQIEIATKSDMREELRYEILMDIGHELSFTCAESGVYNIHFEFPYRRVRDDGKEFENVFPYEVMFACQGSFTQYLVDPETNQVMHIVEWIFKDGEYIQQP